MKNAAKTVNPWKSKDILCIWLHLVKIEPLAGMFISNSKRVADAISKRCECFETGSKKAIPCRAFFVYGKGDPVMGIL
jgi:hypothetical protein